MSLWVLWNFATSSILVCASVHKEMLSTTQYLTGTQKSFFFLRREIAKNMRHHYKIHSALAAFIGLSFFVFQIIAFVELNGTDAIKNYKTFGVAFVIVTGLLLLADIGYIMWQRYSKQTVPLRALHPYEHRSVRSVFFIAHLVLAVLYSILFIRFADHYDTDSGELEEIGYAAFAERQFILGSFAAFIPLVAYLTIREVGYSGDHQKHGYVSAQS